MFVHIMLCLLRTAPSIEGMPIKMLIKWTSISCHIVPFLLSKQKVIWKENISGYQALLGFFSRSPLNCPTAYETTFFTGLMSLEELCQINPFCWPSCFCFSCAWTSSDFAWRKCLSSDLCRQIPIGPIFSSILSLKRFVLHLQLLLQKKTKACHNIHLITGPEGNS